MTDLSTAPDPLLPDVGRLEEWLTANVNGFRGPMRIQRLTGGQSNPTFRLVTPTRELVLRRKPVGPLPPSAHVIEREYKAMHALAGTGVPVPRVHAIDTGEDVVGTAFFIMDMVPGRSFQYPSDPSLSPTERARLFDSINETIAALHNLDPVAIGLGEFGPPRDYLPRTVDRWTKIYGQTRTQTIPEMEQLIRWLPEHLPPEGERRLLHGDFRLDNLIIHPTEPRVVAIIDWELSTVGDPLADFAYHCMAWRFDPDLFRGVAGLDLAALGIPSEEEYVAAYAKRRGLTELPHWNFYMAICMFRFAAILQGVFRRSQLGNAVSTDASTMGAKVAPIARLAWEAAQSYEKTNR